MGGEEGGEAKSSLPFAPMPHQSLGAALGITGAQGPNANIAPYQRGPPEEYLARIAMQVKMNVNFRFSYHDVNLSSFPI